MEALTDLKHIAYSSSKKSGLYLNKSYSNCLNIVSNCGKFAVIRNLIHLSILNNAIFKPIEFDGFDNKLVSKRRIFHWLKIGWIFCDQRNTCIVNNFWRSKSK